MQICMICSMPSISDIFSHEYWFKKNGICAKDVPLAILYFKTISYTSYIVILGLSYKYRFARKLLETNIGMKIKSNIKTTFPNAIKKIESSAVKMSEYLSANQYFQKIPKVLGLRVKRFSKAIVETTIIYKMSLPLYFYCTYKLIELKHK